MTDTFNFKYFSVQQNHCAMKVGTDGVLLGVWAHGGSHVLDIGSGTGLLCLMMAQRCPEAMVDGVEIDEKAAKQSIDNIVRSPFASKISIYHSRIQDYHPTAAYDAIVTNPPFFSNGVEAKDTSRNMARHSIELTFDEIFMFAKEWMTKEGELSAVLPMTGIDDMEMAASLHGFFITRLYKVCTTEKKEPKRCLAAFSKSRPPHFDREQVILQSGDGQRSEWYRELTKSFYIK